MNAFSLACPMRNFIQALRLQDQLLSLKKPIQRSPQPKHQLLKKPQMKLKVSEGIYEK